MWKKILAAVLTLALAITTLNYAPQITKADQSEAAGYDWSTVSYLANGSGVSEYFNRYKMVLASGSAKIDIIQKPEFTTAPGVYVTFDSDDFGTITINDVATTAYSQQGAGLVFHMSGFTEQYNDIVVRNSAGTVKAELYLYDANASETETSGPGETNPGEVEPGQPGSSALAAPANVSAYNFYAQALGYQVIFDAVEGAVEYNVYVDSVEGAVTKIAKSEEYISADVMSAFADGKLHSIYVAAVDSEGNVSVKSTAAKVRVTKQTDSLSDPTDISRIYVVTNSDATITKAEKTAASLTIISGDSSINTVSQSGTIKLRGNSTSLADKPAYNISFSSKQKVFVNASKGKKWCLLANAYEKTMMRNKLAMDFGRTLGNVAAPEEHYADLYIDGVYRGTYVISEPAENDRAGVEYDDSDTSNEMMFELESERVEEDQTYYTTGMGVRFVTDDPEGLDPATDRYSKWVSTLATFESALKKTTSDEILQYMDVDSFVDMYIVNELFNTADFGYSSVKFYIKNDVDGNPIIYAGPLWDFDLSSGNYSTEEVRQYDRFRCQEVNLWFNYLMQNQTFKDKVTAKYESVQPIIQNLYKDNKLGISQITQNYELMKESRIRNYTSLAEGGAGWSESAPDNAEWSIYKYSYSTVEPYIDYTYDQHVEYLTTWLKNRNEWICTQWGIDYTAYDSEYTGVIISDDIDITGYQMTSSFGNIDGSMGFRIVYQAEPVINGQSAEEIGLIYGLEYGDDPVNAEDVVYGSESEYVKSYTATNEGKLSVQMGDSQTASYYVRTMSCGSADGSDNIATEAYTSKYYVRAYAKLADGSLVYSDATEFTIFKVADCLYQNNLVSRKSTYDYLYSKVLHYVDSSYQEGDFDWTTTIVR